MFHKHPLIQMIIAVAALASIGIFIHLSQIPPITTGFYRCIFGIPFLILVNYFSNQKSNAAIKSSYKTTILTLIAGIALGMDMLFWNISFKYTTMAETNLIVNLTPLLIFPITIFYFKEKSVIWHIIPFILAIFGLYLLVFSKNGTHNLHVTGDILSFVAAIFYAIFVVITKIIANQGHNMGKYMVKVIMYCAILLFVAGIISHESFIPSNYLGWLNVITLGFISIIFGQYFLAQSMISLPLQISSMLLLLQPIFAAIYGIILFGEKLSMIQICGAILVLSAIIIFKQIDIYKN